MTQGEAVPVQDTTSLVQAAQRGDDRALDALVSAHLPLVYNVTGRALRRHADVDDVVQETMIQVVRGLPGLREPDRFRSWVVAIAYRQVQMHLRGATRRHLPAREVPEELPDPGGDVEERSLTGLMLTGQRKELSEATQWLDDADRHLLALWWQEVTGELTRAELAAAVGIKATHVAVRVQRMRAQLDGARGLVRALHATPRCPDLAEVLTAWDGATDALWRKRLTRHVRGCPRCSELSADLLAPEKLLPGIAALPLPLLFPVKGVLANLQHFVQTKAAAIAAVVVVAGGGLAFAVYETPLTGEDRPADVAAPRATGEGSPPTRRAPPGPRPRAARRGLRAPPASSGPSTSSPRTATTAATAASGTRSRRSTRPRRSCSRARRSRCAAEPTGWAHPSCWTPTAPRRTGSRSARSRTRGRSSTRAGSRPASGRSRSTAATGPCRAWRSRTPSATRTCACRAGRTCSGACPCTTTSSPG
ncbi:RNA polymerase sigma factor [Dactylosporangium cerinum]